VKIGLVGDYNPDVTAHRAIPAAVEIASNNIGCQISIKWINSLEIPDSDLKEFSGFWCIPASPYQHMNNVLEVIAFARQNNVPFLGTCGGYQHAALEFARNELGYVDADNGESNPGASMPLISALSCRLSNEAGTVTLNQSSKLFQIYGSEVVSETGTSQNPAEYCG
jgi:CTP synthase (UTP-ammonia lyase)